MAHASIYVGNLAYGTMESAVRQQFAPYGRVHSVRILMEWQQGRFHGFAFVVMSDGDALRALEGLKGTRLQGRRLQLRIARPGMVKIPKAGY